MNDSILGRLDAFYNILSQPMVDANLISKFGHGGALKTATPADRTFFCLSFSSSPTRMLVLFLATTEDRIAASIVDEGSTEWSGLFDLMRQDDSEIEEIGMVGIHQFLNPIFNSGSARLLGVKLIVVAAQAGEERVIGVILEFPFGVLFGLQIFDDHRLSMCFNSMCDTILLQAERSDSVRVITRQFAIDERPHFSTVDWFAWLATEKANPAQRQRSD